MIDCRIKYIALFYNIERPSYALLGGFRFGGFVKIGDILLSLREARDLLTFIFDLIIGDIDLLIDEALSLDKDSKL